MYFQGANITMYKIQLYIHAWHGQACIHIHIYILKCITCACFIINQQYASHAKANIQYSMGSPPCNGVYHMNPSTSSFDLHPSVNVTQMLPSWRWDLLLRPSRRCSIPGQLMELKYMKLASRTHRHKLTTKSLQQ